MGVDSSFGMASPISYELQHENVTAADVAEAGSAHAATLMLQQDFGSAYALYAINNTFVTTTNASSLSSLGLSSDWFNSSASSYISSLSIDSSFSYTPSWASTYPTDWWNASFYSLPSWSSNSDPYSNFVQSNPVSSYYGQYSYSPSYTSGASDWWSSSWGASTFSDYRSYSFAPTYNSIYSSGSFGSTSYYDSNSFSNYSYTPTYSFPSSYSAYADYSSFGSSYSSFGSSGSFPPVVLDLAGTGIDITPLSSSNFFIDASNNGYQQRVAWAGSGNGVLVYDPSGGPITQANQFQFTLWDPTARTDMEALQHVFDSNHDGVLDAGDSAWSSFRVLVTNADGTTTLKTLAEAGVASINLQANAYSQTLADGSSIEGQTTFTRTDGTTGIAATARFASEGVDYRVQQTITPNGDGSKTISNSAYSLSGALAETITTTTSADGRTRTVMSDWDGDGVVDQTQTDVTTVAAGVKTRTVTDVAGTGILLSKTTTTTSADGKTVRIARDTVGAGYVGQVEVDTTNADGSTSVAVSNLTRNGSLISRTASMVSSDGLTRTLAIDSAGTGYDDLVEVDRTVIVAGIRTETVTDSNSDGSMRSRDVTVTSADGLTITRSSDTAGNGIFNLNSTDTTVVAAGVRTTTHVDKAANNAIIGRSETKISADGLTTTTKIDSAGSGTYDLIQTDQIVNAAGKRTETVTWATGAGRIYAKQVSVRNADGRTGSDTVYKDVSGSLKLSRSEVRTVDAASGDLIETVTSYSNGVGSGRTITSTSSDGLRSTTITYPIGTQVYTTTETVTVRDEAGAAVTTQTIKASDNTQIAKTVTTTSADGTSTISEQYKTGSVTFDTKSSHIKTHNPDGSIGEVISTRSADGTLLGQTVIVTSADHSTVKTTTVNGAGETTRISTAVTEGDGTVKVTGIDYAPNTAVVGRTVQTTTANGLGVTTQVNSTGIGSGFDGTTSDVTVINANGSRTRTVTDTSGDGTLIDCTITTTSANGLTSVQTTNVDGKIDYTTTDAIMLNNDGSTTERVTVASANGSKISATTTTVSGNGLSTVTSTDSDGDGTTDVTSTDVTLLNADGSRTETVTSVNGTDGSLRSKTVSTFIASGVLSAISRDTAGRGFYDQVETIFTDLTGVVTDTVESRGSAGQRLSRTITTTTGTGLSKTTAVDVNGDNIFDRTQAIVTTYGTDGSTTVTTTSKAGSATTGSTVQSTSANGLTVSTTSYGKTASIVFGSTTDNTVLRADGSREETASQYSSSGALLGQVITTVSGDGKTTAVQKRIDATQQDASRSTSVLQADGSVVTTVSSYSSANVLIGKTVKTASANGLSTALTVDKDGDGVTDDTQSDIIVLNTDGSMVETFIDTVAGGVSNTQVVTTTSANGMTRTVATTGAIKSVTDNNTLTDTTAINNDGSKTATRTIVGTNWSGATLNWSKQVTQSSATGLSTTTTLSAASDTVVDSTRQVVTAVDGSTTSTTTLLKRDGSAFQTDVLTTSADGLSSLLQSKLNGSTTFNHFETKATNGDGSLTDTIWDTNASGATTYKLISSTSASGLDKMVQVMPTDGVTVGSITKDITTLNANGTSVDTVSSYNGAGQLRSRTARTTSADGLSVTTTADVNGDGVVDETTTDVTVVNADGSRTETVTTKYAVSNTQKSKTITTTSANGLSVTTDTTVNTYTKTSNVKTVASNGVQTETMSRYRADGTTLAATVVTTTSADGNLTVITQKNGSGAVTQTETTTVQAGAFGSYNRLVQNGSGTTLYQATHLFDANGVDRVSLTIGSSTYQATLTKEQEGDLQAKVSQMYATVLGRGASRTDLELALQNYSTSGLNLTALTTTTLASSEFSQKYGSLTDVQFIEQIYENALGRGASLAEMANWLGQLAAQTLTRAGLAVAVSESREHITIGNIFQETNNTYSPDGTWALSRTIDTAKANTIVGGLYQATLGHVADTSGLSTDSTALLNGTKTEAQIVAALMASSEFVTNFGSLPLQVFVGRVFVDALSRPPSEAEAQLWTGKLTAGVISKADFILAIANSPDTGNIKDNGDGTEQRLVYSVNSSDVWQSQSQLWQKATMATTSASVSSKDWVTTTTPVWVADGHYETDESGTHWVDTSYWSSQTTTAQQVQSHTHSVVTQRDSVELSVTTVANNGTSTTTAVSNSLGDEPWSHIVLTYEAGNLLDTITANDNGTRSIAILRAAGSDVIAGASTDTVKFAEGISYNQLWFNKSGNDLMMTVIGLNETITLTGWYSDGASRPASIISGDGYSLTYAGIDSLVQSMMGQIAPTSGVNGVSLVATPTPALAVDTSTNKTITSNGKVNVAGLVAGAVWQYSLDSGATWTAGSGTSIATGVFGLDGTKTVQVRQADSRGNYSPAGTLSFTLDTTEVAPTLALAVDTSGTRGITSNGLVNVFGLGLDGTWQYSLNGGTTWGAGSGTTIAAASLGADGAKSVTVRQTDVAGNVSATSTLAFTLDTSAPIPTATLAVDTSGNSSFTSNGQVTIGGLVADAVWEYSMDGGQSWAVGTGSSIAAASFGADGSKTVKVRQTDVAGNVSPVASLTFVLATAASVPILELLQDTSHGQGFTSNGQINVSQLASGGTWQYSLNGGTTWTAGTGTSIATTALGANGAKTVTVRQTDAAGNVSAPVSLYFTLDTAAMSPSLVLAQDTSNGKLATSNGQVNVSGLAGGATWQYSLDGGQTWIAGTGTAIAPAVFGLDGYKNVQVRQTDALGNTSPTASLSFALVHGTPIYAFGEAVGEILENGNGTQRLIDFNTSRTGGWAYHDHLWQKATTTTASANVLSRDWVTTTTPVLVADGHYETDESGTHWVDTSYWSSQTTTTQQIQSHAHSVVTQKDSVELSVTTVANNGMSTTTAVSNSPGDQPWSQVIQSYEGGNLLDTITVNDNGTRSISVNRATGADAQTGTVTDAIIFSTGISHNQLWFNKSGNDLVMTVIGQNETMTLTDWYASATNHVGSIRSGDGYTIDEAGVQAMVQAMVSLTPPLSGQTILPTTTASQLAPALSTNWHHP